MATTMNVRLLVVFLIAAATVLPRTDAGNMVGEIDGWLWPTGNKNFFSEWANRQNFVVGDGDTLEFKFGQGHDVAEVPKQAYDKCDIVSKLIYLSTGPVIITLDKPGTRYFICTIGTTCRNRQKFINVRISYEDAPSSGTSASSLAATFSLILVTIASTIFYLF